MLSKLTGCRYQQLSRIASSQRPASSWDVHFARFCSLGLVSPNPSTNSTPRTRSTTTSTAHASARVGLRATSIASSLNSNTHINGPSTLPASARQYHSTHGESSSNSKGNNSTAPAALLGTLLLGAGLIYSYAKQNKALCEHKPFTLTYEPGSWRDGLPTYTAQEVKTHTSADKRIWVTYKNGVYDITGFIKWHPGGDKILMAAGGALEPFFALYAAHKTHEVMEMVESMRIGNIKNEKPVKIHDAYENDPERSPILVANSEKPFNGEPPFELLPESFITPNSLFFVRNHLPVPQVNPKDVGRYELEACVDKSKHSKRHHSAKLTYEDIKKLPKHTVDVTFMCAGNRRKEMSSVKPVKGLSWEAGSISTATWTGATLLDVLHAMGFKDEDLKAKYIQFEGLDMDPTGAPYGSSISAEKALSHNQYLLVAYEMNGEDIPADHGYPLRMVIPGVVGARSVKWLKRIVISDDESHSHWQRKDYKTFNPSIDFNTCDFDQATAIAETPVQSAICQPRAGSAVKAEDEFVTLKGYAYSGGGRGIIRVDVSVDGGKTWTSADLDNNGTNAGCYDISVNYSLGLSGCIGNVIWQAEMS